MSAFEVTEAAEDDLFRIADYLIGQASPRVADRFLVGIYDVFAGVADMPHAGHRREDLTSRDLRFVSYGRYLVAYDPNTKPVRIIRVLHGSRDVEGLLGE